MNPQIWWYLARASGIVAWLVLTASVLWGIALSDRSFPGRGRPAWMTDLHRGLGALTVALVGLHVGALVADTYVHFGIADVLVPFATSWHPGAVALGIVAGWVLLAVEVTSLLRDRLPRRVWHGIHLASYVTFWLGALHGALAGTDQSSVLYQATGALAIVAVVAATIHRILGGGRPTHATPSPAPPTRPPPDGVSFGAWHRTTHRD